MPRKIPSIVVSWYQMHSQYKVESTTETTEYKPGQMLTEKQVQDLCYSSSWKVKTINPKF